MTARLVCGATGYGGGGGAAQPDWDDGGDQPDWTGAGGGRYDGGGGGTKRPGMSSVGCSVGLTLGGIDGGWNTVGGGSSGETGTSTSDVPS